MPGSGDELFDSRAAGDESGMSIRRVQKFVCFGRLPARVIGGSDAIADRT